VKIDLFTQVWMAGEAVVLRDDADHSRRVQSDCGHLDNSSAQA